MRYSEILTERSLSDVGVRGGKFYLSARGENMNVEHFVATGKLEGVKGVSSSKYIWQEFSPNAGRDIFFVLDANETLRLNDLSRVGYDDPEAMVADNSKMLARILSVHDLAHGVGGNLIQGVFKKIPGINKLDGDAISVMNRADSIAHNLQKGQIAREGDYLKNVDWDSFDHANGLRLSSFDDYANLYYQGAKAAGWYGKGLVKFFAPQNRGHWLPALKQAVMDQASVYADESEWVNGSPDHTLAVPHSTLVIVAMPKRYMIDAPPEKDPERPLANLGWGTHERERWEYFHDLVRALKKSPYTVRVIDADRAAKNLVSSRSKRP